MENSVTSIIEIDKKARAVSEEAAKKAEEVIAAAKAKKESLAKENADRLAADADKKLSALKAASDREIAAAEKAAEEKCGILDEKMQKNKDAWKKEITSRILSFDD